MSCTPFQVDANSLTTSPYGVARCNARATTPLCHSRNQPEPYYLQQWALAGDGGVLRYVPVLNTHHFCCEASKYVAPMSLQYSTYTLPLIQPTLIRPCHLSHVCIALPPSYSVRCGQYGALAAALVCVDRLLPQSPHFHPHQFRVPHPVAD